MVNLRKEPLPVVSTTVYDVAELLVQLNYLKKDKASSYKKLEMMLLMVWLYSLDDGEELFPMTWKISYGRIMPFKKCTEDKLRKMLKEWKPETSVVVPRDPWNLVCSLCSGKKNILSKKPKKQIPKILDSLESYGFKNLDTLTAEKYLNASKTKPDFEEKVSWSQNFLEWLDDFLDWDGFYFCVAMILAVIGNCVIALLIQAIGIR